MAGAFFRAECSAAAAAKTDFEVNYCSVYRSVNLGLGSS
jgi:hypothetical protein